MEWESWSTLYLWYVDDDDNDDDNNNDDNDNDEDNDYTCNSVNFQARTSKFCMEVDLDNIKLKLKWPQLS